MSPEELDAARGEWLRQRNQRAPIMDQDAKEWSIETVGKWIVRFVIALGLVIIGALLGDYFGPVSTLPQSAPSRVGLSLDACFLSIGGHLGDDAILHDHIPVDPTALGVAIAGGPSGGSADVTRITWQAPGTPQDGFAKSYRISLANLDTLPVSRREFVTAHQLCHYRWIAGRRVACAQVFDRQPTEIPGSFRTLYVNRTSI